ncbi:DUF4139 domain-containing protein [Gilliamella sp. wkB112]|uniref:DUF4139 domain-containing protein n=1 Tax=Gilliamella sp. wkB112 TaxID=3120257 RepID=UPI00080DFAB6|nr:DUF4139 domain-containing protein [Gilliamella apicola]OCG02299.1 hypothetical protein A9G12_11380 [Gilliamella apicola]
MKMQKLALLIAFISSSALANNNVTLNKVTLFLNGAELQGQAKVTLTKGESEIVLTGIADNVNPNSIAVGFGADSNVKILSTSLQNNTEADKPDNSDLQPLLTQLKQIQEKYATTNIQYQVASETVAMLQGNRLDGLIKTTDMQDVVEFTKTNLVNALNEQYALQKELDSLKKKLNDCQQKIDQQQAATHSLNNAIAVKVLADKDVTVPVMVSYVITEAGWQPVYDVRVADINSPVQLAYKANVYQQSGIDWQNVDFSLSTANPSEGITAPIFTAPWHIDLYNAEKYRFAPQKNKQGQMFDVGMSSEDFADAKLGQSAITIIPQLPKNNVLINNSGIDTHFDVKLPFTIKSGSKDNVLILQEKPVEAKYRYISTPKLDSNVYLQAQIADWDKLNLLPGKATVFFNGNYIGESFITTKDVQDTLKLSLGRDKNILISRKRNIKETSKPSFLGNDISQKYAYTIDVKNTKQLPIDIAIYDQLPVILNKAITLEDTKYDGADLNKETGLLIWTLALQPSEAKNLNLSFKVSYPKDKVDEVIGL